MQFYYVRDKRGRPRHVVVSSGRQTEDGRIHVVRVGFHPSVSGMSRRGKHPKFDVPMSTSELVEMSSEEVTEDLRREAERALASPASDDSLN